MEKTILCLMVAPSGHTSRSVRESPAERAVLATTKHVPDSEGMAASTSVVAVGSPNSSRVSAGVTTTTTMEPAGRARAASATLASTVRYPPVFDSASSLRSSKYEAFWAEWATLFLRCSLRSSSVSGSSSSPSSTSSSTAPRRISSSSSSTESVRTSLAIVSSPTASFTLPCVLA